MKIVIRGVVIGCPYCNNVSIGNLEFWGSYLHISKMICRNVDCKEPFNFWADPMVEYYHTEPGQYKLWNYEGEAHEILRRH